MATSTNIPYTDLGAIVSFKPEITYNTSRTYKNGKKAPDGIEIRFGNVRPTPEVREKLKAYGFQFSERQVLWYAIDNPKSREFAEHLEANEVDTDDTQLEKRYLWAKVASRDFYDKLRSYTEFMVSDTPPQFFRNKKQLESRFQVNECIYGNRLKFKKFYNHKIGEEEGYTEKEEHDEEEGNESEDEHENPSKPTTQKNNKVDQALAAKLKDMADSMEKAIQSKLNSATSKQRPTPKRLRVAAGMRDEGYYLLNIQKVLYALSRAHHQGAIKDYPFLKSIRTKSQVELLNKYADVHGKKEEDHYLQSAFNNHSGVFKELGITSVLSWSSAFQQKEELVRTFLNTSEDMDRDQRRQVDEQEMKIKSLSIPGFFPTPKALIERLIELLDIQKGHRVLEPSAGKGDILGILKARYGNSIHLSACETNSELRKFLKLKGYDLVGSDFLQLQETFDRIIMNPPFEEGSAIDHVNHALSLLNERGRLVSIMAEGTFSRPYQKERAFRNMLFDNNAYVSEPIKNAFKDGFNQTGVAVRIVVINKDGSDPGIKESESEADNDGNEYKDYEEHQEDEQEEPDLLELEALAEMELLKMEIELKQKKQHLNGLGNINNSPLYPAVWDIH